MPHLGLWPRPWPCSVCVWWGAQGDISAAWPPLKAWVGRWPGGQRKAPSKPSCPGNARTVADGDGSRVWGGSPDVNALEVPSAPTALGPQAAPATPVLGGMTWPEPRVPGSQPLLPPPPAAALAHPGMPPAARQVDSGPCGVAWSPWGCSLPSCRGPHPRWSGAGRGGGHGFPLALPLRVLNPLPPSLTLFPGGRLGNGQSECSPACGGAGQKGPLVLVQPKLSEQEPAEGEPGHRQGHWGLWASGLGLCYGAVTGGRGPGQPSTSSGAWWPLLPSGPAAPSSLH